MVQASEKNEAEAGLKKEEAATAKENEAVVADKKSAAAGAVQKKKAAEAVRSLLCTKHVCTKLSVCVAQCTVVGTGV